MLEAYKHYADFQGRAGRSEYWLFLLFFMLVGIGISVVSGIIGLATGGQSSSLIFGALYALFFLVSFVPSLAVGFRRLHDTDRSAWWLLFSLVPLVGSIVLIVFYCLPGTPGPNRFGSAPGAVDDELQTTFA